MLLVIIVVVDVVVFVAATVGAVAVVVVNGCPISANSGIAIGGVAVVDTIQ